MAIGDEARLATSWIGSQDQLDGTVPRNELYRFNETNSNRVKPLGAAGVVTVGNNLKATFGTRSENLKSDIEEYLRAGGALARGGVAATVRVERNLLHLIIGPKAGAVATAVASDLQSVARAR